VEIGEFGRTDPNSLRALRDINVAADFSEGDQSLRDFSRQQIGAKPVLAIVPGYGIADVVLQGLGGWFAFGLHDFLSSKTLIQTGLATAAPQTARIGRELAASIPQEPTARSGAPIFRYGSGSSDVLLTILAAKAAATKIPIVFRHRWGSCPIGRCYQFEPSWRQHHRREHIDFRDGPKAAGPALQEYVPPEIRCTHAGY
jgi:hypothetical protein